MISQLYENINSSTSLLSQETGQQIHPLIIANAIAKVSPRSMRGSSHIEMTIVEDISIIIRAGLDDPAHSVSWLVLLAL